MQFLNSTLATEVFFTCQNLPVWQYISNNELIFIFIFIFIIRFCQITKWHYDITNTEKYKSERKGTHYSGLSSGFEYEDPCVFWTTFLDRESFVVDRLVMKLPWKNVFDFFFMYIALLNIFKRISGGKILSSHLLTLYEPDLSLLRILNHLPSKMISLGWTKGRRSFRGMYTSPSGPVPRQTVEDWVKEPT